MKRCFPVQLHLLVTTATCSKSIYSTCIMAGYTYLKPHSGMPLTDNEVFRREDGEMGLLTQEGRGGEGAEEVREGEAGEGDRAG